MNEAKKSWIGVNEVIARDREYEIYHELNSGINLKYKEFILKREKALIEAERKYAIQREKLRIAALRKTQETELERSV